MFQCFLLYAGVPPKHVNFKYDDDGVNKSQRKGTMRRLYSSKFLNAPRTLRIPRFTAWTRRAFFHLSFFTFSLFLSYKKSP